MTSSLRIKVVLPIVGTSVITAVLFSLFLLGNIESSISFSMMSHLDQTAAILESSIRDTPPTDISLDTSRGAAPRTVLVWFGADSSRIYPDPLSSNPDLPGTIADIHPPEDFRQVEMVGRLIHPAEVSGYAAGDRYIALLMTTDESKRIYAETRMTVLIFSAIGVMLIGILAGVIVSRLNRRIEELRNQVSGTVPPSGLPATGHSNDVLARLATDILDAQERINASKKEIARLQVVRSQFLANVSHEVRTPLFSLKGFLETLLDGGLEDPEVNRVFLEKALLHAQRIDNLLRDLIDIARIESGEMRMSFRYFSLASLLRQVHEDHVDIAEARNQTFRVIEPGKDIEVMGDKDRLEQALSNLIENAIKYSPEGSSVTLSVQIHPASVTVSVSDNGPGIPREHVSRIFERFYRIDPERSRDVGGTGLGLAIVKHIVEAHGSEIHIQSSQGEGSTFSFRLKR